MTAPGLEHELALGALRGALAACEARPELAGAALARLLGLPSVAAPPAPPARPARARARTVSPAADASEVRALASELVEAAGGLNPAARAAGTTFAMMRRWVDGASCRSDVPARLRAALDAVRGEAVEDDDQAEAEDDDAGLEVPAAPPFRRGA